MVKPLNETRFVQVYCELTGASATEARSAYMYACAREDGGTNSDEALPLPVSNHSWEKATAYERSTKSRPLPDLHPLSGATRQGLA